MLNSNVIELSFYGSKNKAIFFLSEAVSQLTNTPLKGIYHVNKFKVLFWFSTHFVELINTR